MAERLTFAEQVEAAGRDRGAMANRDMAATPLDRLGYDPNWRPVTGADTSKGEWQIPEFADYPVPQAAQFRWWFAHMAPITPPWRVRISASLAFRYTMVNIAAALAPVAFIVMTADGRHPAPQFYPESVQGSVQFDWRDQDNRPVPSANSTLWLPDHVERTR